MPRMIFHNLPSNLTIGVDVDSAGDIYASLAACHRRDLHKRTRKVANTIINERLDRGGETHKVFIGNYKGPSLTKDVYGPIRDAIRCLTPRRNVSGVMRRLKASMISMALRPATNVATMDFGPDSCSGSSCPA